LISKVYRLSRAELTSLDAPLERALPGSTRKRTRTIDEENGHPATCVLTLQRELQGRFVSSGGRPADPAPTIRRLVTVKKEVWKELKRQAAVLSKIGERVTPGQLAAMMLEDSLAAVQRRGHGPRHFRAEGGGQERDLAAKYRGWSQKLAFEYPYVARVLEDIAASYDREAEWHDSEANGFPGGGCVCSVHKFADASSATNRLPFPSNAIGRFTRLNPGWDAGMPSTITSGEPDGANSLPLNVNRYTPDGELA
jgi:hypothetical protein